MTLQDLKTGMVVEMRDGRKRQQCTKEKKPFNGHWQQYGVVDVRSEFFGE